MPRRTYDVAIVGAGVIGAAIAHECASRGAAVLLIDRGTPGGGASGAAAGMLAPCSEAHTPGPFLEAARESLALWPSFAARAQADGGIDPELTLDGLLRVAPDADAATDVQARLRWQRETGIAEGTWVDQAEARNLEPALSADVQGAAWYPNEGHVHSRRAVEALVAAARARGAEVRHGVAVGDRSTVDAQRVILAAGAWLGDLAPRFGGTLPVRPVHGQLLVLHGIPRPPRRVVFAGLQGYVVAKRDGTVLSGATEETRGFDTTPDAAATERLRTQAAGLIDGVDHATGVHPWTGLRPAAPDGLPLLGPLPGRDDDRVLVAGGHYRNGVLLAPLTARGMADMALDGRTPPGWSAFDPRRLG
ncbi:MAG TPA: glycine oxidase ThiO [Candidatus Dormibacteraeota bacterium]|jgi:glycine oxidase|nr:glycine oxidase ThiO [Candidatus Dormibacteraeota bacterium]